MKKYIFLSVALLTFTVGCNNSDDNNIIDKQPRGLQFSFSEEGYGEDEVLSRATVNQPTRTETVDLGDCEAEVSVESEPAEKQPQAATRGISGKHYTIRAYQGGVRIAEIKGQFYSSTFYPDAGSKRKFTLPKGIYEFVAFNDKVTPNGENLEVSNSNMQEARIGTTTVNINQDDDMEIAFEMKHVCARLRTQFVCQKHIPNNITATLEETAANVIPASVSYNPITKVYTATNAPMAAKNCDSYADNRNIYAASTYGQNYAYNSTSKYHYFMPTTSGANLKFTFNAGIVFIKTTVAGTLPQINTALSMQPNKSYLVKIKLKPKFKYLFSDGTTGFRTETTYGGAPAATAKTPIGVVVKDNDGTPSSGIAMALEYANGGNLTAWGPVHNYANKLMYQYKGNKKEYSGYDITWNPATSYDGVTVKGNSTTYPSFYQAGHYAPAVPVTGANVSKWYLPAGMEMYAVLKNLYFSREHGISNHGYYSGGYGYLLEQAVTQVGGSLTMNKAICAATEDNDRIFEFYGFFYYGLYFSIGKKQTDRAHVRPFVRF